MFINPGDILIISKKIGVERPQRGWQELVGILSIKFSWAVFIIIELEKHFWSCDHN